MKPYYFVKIMINGTLDGDVDHVDENGLAEIVGSEICDQAVFEVLYGTGAYTRTRMYQRDDGSELRVDYFVTTSEHTGQF